MENLTRCLVCGSEIFSLFLECTDHFISGENFKIARCNNCGFCFTNPRPDITESSRYYESDEYISHSKTEKGLVNRLFHISRKFTIKRKKQLVRRYALGEHILDYGCGTGEFLASMQSAGFICRGVEPNKMAREYASTSYGLDVIPESQFENLGDNTLGAITLWHVLEHVYPIEKRVEQFYDKLLPGGILIVALPNKMSYDAKKYGSFWAAYDLPRHIHHFTPETIIRFMDKFSFEHIKTKPMMLDSLYISLLSEKYKHGRQRFIYGIFTGLASNAVALIGKRNYSSLIYIFKKSI